MLAVGIAFWTIAAWLFLLTVTTAVNAPIILGALYTGAGLVGFGVASMRSQKTVQKPAPPEPVSPKSPEATLEKLIAAFISGMNAGAKTRS